MEAIMSARLLITASALTPALSGAALAQGKSEQAPGHDPAGPGLGNVNSASEFAPGQLKDDDESAMAFAPGQLKEEDESARDYAPGQIKRDDEHDPDLDL
jgi:hypothetical protein